MLPHCILRKPSFMEWLLSTEQRCSHCSNPPPNTEHQEKIRMKNYLKKNITQFILDYFLSLVRESQVENKPLGHTSSLVEWEFGKVSMILASRQLMSVSLLTSTGSDCWYKKKSVIDLQTNTLNLAVGTKWLSHSSKYSLLKHNLY